MLSQCVYKARRDAARLCVDAHGQDEDFQFNNPVRPGQFVATRRAGDKTQVLLV